MQFLSSARSCLVAVFSVLLPASALAQTPAAKVISDVRLDIDGDGRTDLARLTEDGQGAGDLSIYRGIGDREPEPGKTADFVKKAIAGNVVMAMAAIGKRSLVVTDSCGGCTHSAETRLTIVHRKDAFIVAGLIIDWEFRDSSGRCDINFLTGKGFTSKGLNGRQKPIPRPLKVVRLKDWDPAVGRDICYP